ncbi:sulfotransferase family protein [Nocardioides bizhenqiangii]|uniref:Sulfotransferase n=1 Tax=Nocardioides bizhenqiangii TaxID=3095076 RepID=A0ABZ0ZNW1_9ACTN|nr:sulfotransferase [Nocardioides sp. HM61]WQQ25985.1 sulfotransferase [Nocardioides sp. HM61]
MTTLSRSSVEPDLLTVQCDVCFPQHIATTTLEVFAERRWLLRERGDDVDMCHHCRFEPQQGQTPRVERARGVESTGSLPNFFIIGAAKAGTTSLHFYLDQHPDVFMAEAKELHYFCDPDCADWLALYREQFPADAKIRGEASTLYTRSPAIPGVPARMAALVPDARLVYLVRDPVERAMASWREERFHVTERRPAEEAFRHPEDPHNPYVAASRYAQQLEGFLEHYPAERVLVLDQRELATATGEVVEQVVGFLGLPQHPIDTETRHNEGGTKLEYSSLGHRLRFSAPARAVRRMPLPARRALTAPARRLLRRPIEAPELPADLMTRLRETLAPDAARLRELTGLPLSHWTV